MMELQIIEFALQGIKVKENYECCERILNAARNLNVAKTECRRAKTTELIQARVKIETSLEQLENSYSELKAKYGRVEAIERVIREQKQELVQISFSKAHLKKR